MRSIQTNPMIFMSDRLSIAFYFSRRAHLLTTPKGRWYFLRKPCALRGGCSSCESRWTRLQFCQTASLVHAVGAGVPFWKPLLMGWYIATPSRRLPAKTCHRQLLRSYGYRIFGDTHFLFSKEKQKERTVKTNGNLSSGSKSSQPWYRKKRCCSFRLSELF